MPVVHLTDRFIRHVSTEKSVEDFREEGFPGFGLRVTERGRKTFFIVYPIGGRRRRLGLGRYPIVSLKRARQKARDALVQVDKGSDPQGVRIAERNGATFGELVEQFMDLYAEQRHSAAWLKYEREVLDRDVLPVLGTRRVADIRKADVVLLLDAIAKRSPVTANRTRAILSRISTWALSRDLVEVNPIAGVPKPGGNELPREKVLTEDEVKNIWLACEEESSRVTASLQLVLLTAQRGGEVRSMRWEDLDGTWWTIPRAKSGRSHRVFLSPQSLAILERVAPKKRRSKWVFPARRGKAVHLGRHNRGAFRVREASGVSGWTTHDLRRTAATMMASMGISPFVVEKILGHADRRGITAIYDRSSYDADKRAALLRWGTKVEEIVSDQEVSKVLSFTER